MYRVSKILNNNGVIAINTEDNQEYVLLGKGIGFGKKVSQRFEVTEDTACLLYTSTQVGQPIIWMLIYVLITATVVYKGVNKGIEKYSKILMPILFVLIAGISVFSITLKHTCLLYTSLSVEM